MLVRLKDIEGPQGKLANGKTGKLAKYNEKTGKWDVHLDEAIKGHTEVFMHE